MAQFTSNIGLHQWEPGDNFLRTDFNQDFAKIDGAFGALDPRFAAAETARGWLEDAAARMGYEALQSRLSAHAGGKKLPAGRGLLFDSFRTGDALTLTGGCGMKDGGGVLLDTVGLTSFEYAYGTDTSLFMSYSNGTNRADQNFTASGNGILETLSLYMMGVPSENYGAEVSILEGSASLWSETRTLTGSVAAYTFRPKLTLKKGTVYTIRVKRTHDRMWLYQAKGGSGFGYKVTCTSKGGTSGTITTAAQPAEPFRSLRVWVRHSGGTVGCAFQRGSGAFTALSKTGSRETVDCRGTACTETEFSLTGLPRQGGSVCLRVNVQNSTDMLIHDVGMALL